MAVTKGQLVSEILDLEMGGGELQKLKIRFEEERKNSYTGEIEALFNPEELKFARTAKWEPRRLADKGWASAHGFQQFVSSNPQTLSIRLRLDTYESRSDKALFGQLKETVVPESAFRSSRRATSVKTHTDRLDKLIRINQELHRPPRCKLSWGRFQFFRGVVTELKHTFSMFMPDGTPVRAEVDCSFVELNKSFVVELHSADVPKTRTVRQNDTLHSIAAEVYDDPALWRHIAKANHIVNPRTLQPGTALIIPSLLP